MTDGKSQDNVLSPARMLRRRGISLYAVGIGKHYNTHQLRQIAGDKRRVLTAPFKNLISIVNTIGRRACRGKVIDTRRREMINVILAVMLAS